MVQDEIHLGVIPSISLSWHRKDLVVVGVGPIIGLVHYESG